MVSEGLAEDDIIEHLNDPDTAPVCLMCQERIDFFVFLKCFLVHLQGKGIVFQLHQRSKGMAVPQVQRIVLVLNHHIEILHPLLFVIEPREVLGCIGIFIDGMARQIYCFLQSDACAAHHHTRLFHRQLNI